MHASYALWKEELKKYIYLDSLRSKQCKTKGTLKYMKHRFALAYKLKIRVADGTWPLLQVTTLQGRS